MIRLWQEHLGNGQKEWRGQAQHVNSGEIHYFRDWEALIDFFSQALSKIQEDRDSPAADEALQEE